MPRAIASPVASVLIIDNSSTLAQLLADRIDSTFAARTRTARDIAEAEAMIGKERPQLVITGLALPDGPRGEVLQMLERHALPALVFTATIDRRVRTLMTSRRVVDYFLKDGPGAVDAIVGAAQCYLDNRATGVLIVDDMASGRAMLAEIVRRCNYRVFEARSGAEALDLLDGENAGIDLVITDFFMPDLDGEELTRRIRARHTPEQLRVIGISSSTDPFLSATLLKSGAADFIYRPFIDEEVKVRIESNVANLKLIRDLRFFAERDSLTGMLNRRAFFAEARRLLATSSGPSHMALIDIDHFKRINDTHGHEAGDEALCCVAEAIEDFVAQSGRKILCARFGGEEFALLLAGMAGDATWAALDDLRRSIGALPIRTEAAQFGLTVSIGIAPLSWSGEMDSALNAADQALYVAKQAGRNRLSHSGGLR